MNMTNGIENVRRLAVMLQGLVELADQLEGIQSVEGLANQLKDEATKAKAERDEAQAEAAEAKAEAKKAGDKVKEAMEKANAEAQALIQKARDDADGIVEAARAAAAQAVDAANRKVNSEAQKVADYEAKRDALTAELSELSDKLAQVKAAIAALKG